MYEILIFALKMVFYVYLLTQINSDGSFKKPSTLSSSSFCDIFNDKFFPSSFFSEFNIAWELKEIFVCFCAEIDAFKLIDLQARVGILVLKIHWRLFTRKTIKLLGIEIIFSLFYTHSANTLLLWFFGLSI